MKNKAKSSFKSVILNYKEFLGIYAAILIVQLLVGVWSLTAFTNYKANDSVFDENYTYDVLITGDNHSVTNLGNQIRFDMSQEGSCIDNLGYEGGKLGVIVKDGEFDRFYDEYLKTLEFEGKIEYDLTPKYVYHTEIQSDLVSTAVLIGALVFILGILILSVMYSIRTNHYKFQYGIYMTFGADKRMLGSIALNELLAINTLTLIPSAVISYLLTLTVYAQTPVSIVISFWGIILYIALTYLIAFISACFSVGSLFIKPPVALITTADNSNFVSSPRRSFAIFAKKMPLHYELYSCWRFRKYIVKLVLGAVAFSVLFVAGIYGSNMMKTENLASKNEFSIIYNYSTQDEDLRERANREAAYIVEGLLKLENIDKIDLEQSTRMSTETSDHILIKNGVEKTGSSNTVPSSEEYDGYTRASNSCRYVCIDEILMKNYERRYKVEYLDGVNAQNIAENKNYIVVSNSIFGTECFDFKVGDKVVLANCIDKVVDPNQSSDPKKRLMGQIDNSTFTYTEYTVAAVVHENDMSEDIIFGVNVADYERLLDTKHAYKQLDVYVDAGMDLADITAVREAVKNYMEYYEAWGVEVVNGAVYSIVDNNINLPGLLTVISVLTLLICPTVWIFSQVMFYRKREEEYKLLHAMGATLKEIGGIHLVSALLIFIISFVVNFGLSRLVCFAIYRIFTKILPNIGVIGVSVAFADFVPVSTVLICAAVSALCGLLSAMIPYLIYCKKLKDSYKTINDQSFQ